MPNENRAFEATTMQGPGYSFEWLAQNSPPLWVLVNGLGALIVATYIAVCVLSKGFPCI